MQNIARYLLHTIDRHLGRCPRCMKTAFLLASLSWMAVLIVKAIGTEALAIEFFTAIAFGLTALWTMHFS